MGFLPPFSALLLTGLLLLCIVLLIMAVGTVDFYLSIEELFDYDPQRIPPRFSPEERKALCVVLWVAALGGASAVGIIVAVLHFL